MIDREILRTALDCATRINDDGKAETVAADATYFVEWYNRHMDAARDRTRAAFAPPASPIRAET